MLLLIQINFHKKKSVSKEIKYFENQLEMKISDFLKVKSWVKELIIRAEKIDLLYCENIEIEKLERKRPRIYRFF